MALRFAENFNGYGTGTTGRTNMLTGIWATVDTTVIVPSTTSPRGLGVSHLRNTEAGTTPSGARVVIGAATPDLFMGAAYRLSALPGAAGRNIIFRMMDVSNVAICSLCVSATGVLELRQGQVGTVVADSNTLSPTPPIIAGSYQFVEMYVDIGNGASPADGSVIVRVDGTTVINASGIDTRDAAAGSTIQSVYVNMSRSGLTADMADLYILDGTGSVNNTFLGDTQWLDIAPDADLAESDWTRNTGATDFGTMTETTPDGDTTYISAGIVGDRSEFGLADLPASVSEIVAVVSKVMTRKTDAGTCNLQVSVVSGELSPATVSTGTDRPITETYTYYRDTFETDPGTGIAWTPAAVNAIDLRFEKTA